MNILKLNNKGFAITGILYTVFILFLMILVGILSALNSKIVLLEENIKNINEDIEEKCYTDSTNISKSITGNIANYSGKYVFNNNCISYIGAGTDVTKAICQNGGNINDSTTVSEFCTSDKVS